MENNIERVEARSVVYTARSGRRENWRALVQSNHLVVCSLGRLSISAPLSVLRTLTIKPLPTEVTHNGCTRPHLNSQPSHTWESSLLPTMAGATRLPLGARWSYTRSTMLIVMAISRTSALSQQFCASLNTGSDSSAGTIPSLK